MCDNECHLIHYGIRIGSRHARKHLGWSLDVAAMSVGAGPEASKFWRARVLTAERPEEVRALLVDAFSELAWKAAA